jgi:hypothetical protein
LLNVNSTDDGKIVVGFLLNALKPRGPHPVLEITGPQGAAKSTATRLIRDMVDPNVASLRMQVKTPQDLAITAQRSWIPTCDNASRMTQQLSDAWCILATGGAYATRKLYTTDDETILKLGRPSIVNGINPVAVNADLLSRTWPVTFRPVVRRRTEQEVSAEFERIRSQVLGALLDAVSHALRTFHTIPTGADRMADAESWVTAAEPALGWAQGTFTRILKDKRDETACRALDDHEQLVAALQTRAAAKWEGTATALLNELQAEQVGGLPLSASALSNLLGRLEPVLGVKGISLTGDRHGKRGERIIFLRSTASAVSDVERDEQ